MTFDSVLMATLAAIVLTLAAHVIARVLARKLSWLPMVITALALVLLFLFILQWDYNNYYSVAKLLPCRKHEQPSQVPNL